jgi:hypothetical protein
MGHETDFKVTFQKSGSTTEYSSDFLKDTTIVTNHD